MPRAFVDRIKNRQKKYNLFLLENMDLINNYNSV